MELIGNHGNNGNNGLPGREGMKGDLGNKGGMGPRGERGVQGIKGMKGQAGIPSELKVRIVILCLHESTMLQFSVKLMPNIFQSMYSKLQI